ncbi:MAG: AraC family transcriptional regulator, partial [Microbacterium sp.]
GADTRHRLAMHGDDRFTLVRFEAAGAFTGSSEAGENITIATATGRLDWEIGDERGTSSEAFLRNPSGLGFSHFGPMIMFGAFLRRAQLTEFAHALYGVDDVPLRFDGSRAASPEHAQQIAALLRYADGIADGALFDDDIVRSLLYRRIAVGILESFRLQGDRPIRARGMADRARRFRSAMGYIGDRAATAITPEDVAVATGLGSRELDDIFRGHSADGADLEQSIARARLDAVHRELRLADPDEQTVRTISARFGFTSPTQLNVLYQRAYGTTPGRTLHA